MYRAPAAPFAARRRNWRQVSLPLVTPMPLARLEAPFDHPDWIFELKMDGHTA
jgi:hypothetical protein